MDRQDIATCFLLTNRYGVRAWQSTTTKRRRNQCRRRTKSGCLMYLQAYSMSHLESLTDAESLARKEEGSCPFHKLQEPVCYSNFHALSSWITEKASVIIHHSFDSWNGRQNLHAITLELRLKNKRWTVQKKKIKISVPCRDTLYMHSSTIQCHVIVSTTVYSATVWLTRHARHERKKKLSGCQVAMAIECPTATTHVWVVFFRKEKP